MRVVDDLARAPRPPLTQSLVGGAEQIDRLGEEWRALCAEGPSSDPFFRPGWIAAHLRAFEPRARLRIVVVRADGSARLILPLVQERSTLRGFPVRKLRAAAGVHSCRFDVVCGRGDPEPWIRAAWAHLRQTGGWDVIELCDVPAGGAAERLAALAAADGHPTGAWESMRTPYVRLAGARDVGEILARTGSHFRANLRRRRRRLEERGALRLRRIDAADPEALARFYELERMGWKGERGTAIDCDRRTRRFYDEIAGWAAAEGILSLRALELDGRAIAMHFGLTAGGRYLLPKPAYDPSLSACSPGQLLLHEVLRDCIEQGLSEFDFLGPWMEWKADWTQDVRPHHWHYVFRRGALGRALHAAKFRLPKLKEALRGR
ncbi:MAG TPA: GNAT family N-acetyltransferase [Vulgatibacter sp.]|nr:GNAT family N-acetyltransferase [Vulgatibacter sp.]